MDKININEELQAYLDQYFPNGDVRRSDALVIVSFANTLLSKKNTEKEIIETKHKFRMEEIEAERNNAVLIHNQILERGRIQRAEERKIMLEKKSMQRGRFS